MQTRFRYPIVRETSRVSEQRGTVRGPVRPHCSKGRQETGDAACVRILDTFTEDTVLLVAIQILDGVDRRERSVNEYALCLDHLRSHLCQAGAGQSSGTAHGTGPASPRWCPPSCWFTWVESGASVSPGVARFQDAVPAVWHDDRRRRAALSGFFERLTGCSRRIRTSERSGWWSRSPCPRTVGVPGSTTWSAWRLRHWCCTLSRE